MKHVAVAVAQTHLQTGVPAKVHTDSATRSVLAALDFSCEESVDLSRVMTSHAGGSTNLDYLTKIADSGVLLGMDRFELDLYDSTDSRVATLIALLSHGYADRIMLSHDIACFADWLGGGPEPFRAQYFRTDTTASSRTPCYRDYVKRGP